MLTRRLAVVVGGPGYGKTSLLRDWSAARPVAMHGVTSADRALNVFARSVASALRLRVPGLPEHLFTAFGGGPGPRSAAAEPEQARAFAEQLCVGLEACLVRDVVLALDDVHELEGAVGSLALLAGLVRQAPRSFHLVLASRRDLTFPVARLRGQDEIVEVTGPDLAFTSDETAALVEQLLGSEPELAACVHEVTGGWPAAVRLAIEGLRVVVPAGRLDALRRMPRRNEPLFRYLTEEALAAEPGEVRELLSRLAPLEIVHEGLGEALGLPNAPDLLAATATRGVWLRALDGEPGWYVFTPLVRGTLREHAGLPNDDILRSAAEFFEGHGRPELALACIRHIDDAATANLLRRRGPELLAAGRVAQLIEGLSALPESIQDDRLRLFEAEARQIQGDWDGALRCLRAAVPENEPLLAEHAWRLGLIHHLRGELEEAETAYARGVRRGDDIVNEALLLAWWAALRWLRGDTEGCRERAFEALALATSSGDDQALATAHTVVAMEAALRSDRAANDAHYLRALEHGERAHDVLLLVRVRTNRGSRLLEEGFAEEALDELDDAIRLADVAGYALFKALALSNRGQALRTLGRLEDAARELDRSRAEYERMNSRMVAYPLVYLGEVHRLRGDLALARGCYEEAIAHSEPAGDLQGLVPALAGLARVTALDDPAAAVALAERAVALGPVLGQVPALLAAAAAHLASGETASAVGYADQAAEVARSRRDRAGLAEALELLASARPDAARLLLEEALALWRALRDPIGESRTELHALRVGAISGAAHALADLEQRCRTLGCRTLAAEAADLSVRLEEAAMPPVAIRTLGGFAVYRHGERMPTAAWQSRKARDLLKMLVARRGVPVPRDQLIELLWPDEDPKLASRRLSVTLSTLRAALDPEKRHPADHVIASDGATVRVVRDEVAIDVEAFLEDAELGLSQLAQGAHDAAVKLLTAADAAYVGDFLEEDVYSDWSAPLRDRAREVYISTARALAAIAAEQRDFDGAARYLLRVLERDVYDEGAHLGLVSTLAAGGRHGEARRAYRVYLARMEDLHVEPEPFPAAERAGLVHPSATPAFLENW